MKKEIQNPSLKSWNALNATLMNSGEQDCVDLLAEEVEGRNRTKFKQRIHSRINKLRADREREELLRL